MKNSQHSSFNQTTLIWKVKVFSFFPGAFIWSTNKHRDRKKSLKLKSCKERWEEAVNLQPFPKYLKLQKNLEDKILYFPPYILYTAEKNTFLYLYGKAIYMGK